MKQPKPPAEEAPPPKRRPGRPCLPDTRRHCLRIACNDEELTKFRILQRLTAGLSINVMAREIVLDELNALLADSPRRELIATLQTHGLDEGAIESLLKSI